MKTAPLIILSSFLIVKSCGPALGSSEEQCRQVFNTSKEIRELVANAGSHDLVSLVVEIAAESEFDLVAFFARYELNYHVIVTRGEKTFPTHTGTHLGSLEFNRELLNQFFKDADFSEVEIIKVYPNNNLSLLEFIEKSQRLNARKKHEPNSEN